MINIDFKQWKVFGMPVGKTESDVTDILDLALHAQMEPAFFLNVYPLEVLSNVRPWKFTGTQKEAGESLPLPSFFSGL